MSKADYYETLGVSRDADAGAIERAWGWRPRVREIGPMIESAWRFARRHPRGYGSR